MHGIDETVHIPEGASVEAFLGKVAAINRRAKRLGLGLSLTCEEVGREPRPVRVTRNVFRDGAFERVTQAEARPCVIFRMACPEPVVKLPGWEFEGYIAAKNGKRDTSTGTVHAASYTPFTDDRKVPQGLLDRAFSDSGMMRCDHCGTFRNRRVGIVVRDADGGHKVVGSNCARDFLGHDFRAIAGFYQHIAPMRRELEAERNVGWYALHEYDYEQARKDERAAAAKRDAVRRPVRTVVGAILKAMGEQGFYARTDWDGRKATAGEAQRHLDGGFELSPGVWGKVDEILAWMRVREPYAPLFEAARPSLGRYRAVDPEFRVVKDFMDAGGIPLGRFYEDGEKVVLSKVSSEPVEVERQVGWRTETVRKTRHVLRDGCGSRFELVTTSAAVDAAVGSGVPFEATFIARGKRVHRCRAHTDVSRLTPVRGPAPKVSPRARRQAQARPGR